MVNLYGKRILRVRVFVSQNKKRFNNCSRSKIALDVIVVFLQHLRCFYFLLFLSFFNYRFVGEKEDRWKFLRKFSSLASYVRITDYWLGRGWQRL